MCDIYKEFCLHAALRQMDANGAKSTTSAGQCRLTPLIPLILDSSFLYHFSVRLMFKLHSREGENLILLFTLITNMSNGALKL